MTTYHRSSVLPPKLEPVKTRALLAGLEKELSAFGIPRKGEDATTHACAMNLVVVASSRALADRTMAIADEVGASIPLRAIVVFLDTGRPEDTLTGTVSRIPDSHASLSERVRLDASGSLCLRIGSAVFALSVPELPTTLLWAGKLHVDDPVFQSLLGQAERVIVDTHHTALASVVKLARHVERIPQGPSVADLSWTRLSVWQEMCARFFDEPTLRAHAARVKRIVLKQLAAPGERLGSEGLLLLGWLATRLSLSVVRMGDALRLKRPDGGFVSLELGSMPVLRDHDAFELGFVGIETGADGSSVKGSVERVAEEGGADVLVWRLLADVPNPGEQRVRMRSHKGGLLLDRTLHRPSRDPALAESLAFVQELLDDGLVCQ